MFLLIGGTLLGLLLIYVGREADGDWGITLGIGVILWYGGGFLNLWLWGSEFNFEHLDYLFCFLYIAILGLWAMGEESNQNIHKEWWDINPGLKLVVIFGLIHLLIKIL